MALADWLTAIDPLPRTVRIGVTGLARAGKTTFLTSVAANMLAAGAGQPALPALSARLAGRQFTARLSPARAEALPRFTLAPHLAALAAEPPHWPESTRGVSLLSMALEIGRGGLAEYLPARDVTLEFLDYPGEWLLDLPLLDLDFAGFSAAMLARIAVHPEARPFLDFTQGLGAAGADERLAEAGHVLYRDALQALARNRLVWLQPGRFLMPLPGPTPPWMVFFPLPGSSPLARLMAERFDAYRDAVRRDLSGPHFGRIDRLVVLADVLAALHGGEAAWADTRQALSAVAGSLRMEWWRRVPGFDLLFGPGVSRVAFAATKADHVADRQRRNLATLVQSLTVLPEGSVASAAFAIASVRCTEDFVWTLEGRPVSAVRGRVLGSTVMTRSYPGEVPDKPPGPEFWQHPFLALPIFEPPVLADAGRSGVPHLELDRLLAFLLEDVL